MSTFFGSPYGMEPQPLAQEQDMFHKRKTTEIWNPNRKTDYFYLS